MLITSISLPNYQPWLTNFMKNAILNTTTCQYIKTSDAIVHKYVKKNTLPPNLTTNKTQTKTQTMKYAVEITKPIPNKISSISKWILYLYNRETINK